MIKISSTSRIIIAISSLSLIVTYFVPIWRIDLFAPQYPEGLTMKIWLYTLKGDVEIINGLNHYIGMRHIKVEMFPEFSFLIYIVAFYILLGLMVAYFGRLAILFWYLVFTAFGGVFSMFDFYRWGYDYGHNLDDTAAIKVPGLSYQPPLIGHKRLLNFDAYSLPDIGGWIVFIAATIMLIIWIYEYYRHHKFHMNKPILGLLFISLFSISCNVKPEPFKYGVDICYTCKMGIIEPRFGAECVTKKGKIYKFDDIGCMVRLLKSGMLEESELKYIVVANYEKENELLDVNTSTFVVGTEIKSPMNFNTAAFSDTIQAKLFILQKQLKILDWHAVYQNIE
ncbi:MAG: nitrous oxide reductase accessory protein NosL [Saprospiraceae bacterium]|nr:nitrous oxide reductase accessory protein NosL [Saprospiraceae bacterium]